MYVIFVLPRVCALTACAEVRDSTERGAGRGKTWTGCCVPRLSFSVDVQRGSARGALPLAPGPLDWLDRKKGFYLFVLFFLFCLLFSSCSVVCSVFFLLFLLFSRFFCCFLFCSGFSGPGHRKKSPGGSPNYSQS